MSNRGQIDVESACLGDGLGCNDDVAAHLDFDSLQSLTPAWRLLTGNELMQDLKAVWSTFTHLNNIFASSFQAMFQVRW
jgi:hypothetical protein